MEPVKDAKRVNAMWRTGQPTMVDPSSGYKYSMVASCPKDGGSGSVSQVFKEGQGMSRVVFQCATCGDKFEVARKDICVY